MTHAVKFADGSDNIIEGLAIPYGKDLHGEAFGPGTDLALDWFPDEGRPFLYHHALDPEIKTAVIGRQVERWQDDAGHWVRIQLDKRSKYLDSVRELVQSGGLGLSSGAMAHLVTTRKDGQIERWPWVEISGTPSPAHPGASLYAVKTVDAIEHIAAAKAAIPDPLRDIIDEWAGSEADPLLRLEAASADIRGLVDKAEKHAAVRALAKRRISAGTVERLTAVRDQAQQVIGDIDALLVDSQPIDTKAIDQEYARFLFNQDRLNGMPVS